MRMERW